MAMLNLIVHLVLLVHLVYVGSEVSQQKGNLVQELSNSRHDGSEDELELFRQKRIDEHQLTQSRQKRLSFERESSLEKLTRVRRDLDEEIFRQKRNENEDEVELSRQKRINDRLGADVSLIRQKRE
ncbi:hypothetical protein Btru_020253 [Bulinus truncatus]|nr:hypothetical protein Btru_020253 [Bulinus truncatus]